MIKVYESDKLISNLTIIVGGKARRISFLPVSPFVSRADSARAGTCSRFETGNKELQNALESKPMFGSAYRLIKTIQTEETPKPKKVEPAKEKIETSAPAKEEVKTENIKKVETDTPTKGESGLKKIKVASPGDARDYLQQNFGVEPKTVYLVNALKSKAKSLGIEFEGI